MGSLKDPKTWIPYINPKDCSQKICSISCPQWCKYIIYPSPPPPLSNDDSGGITLSPAVIVIITLICAFLLLIGYYVIISLLLKRRIDNLETGGVELGVDGHHDLGDQDHSNYVPWIVLGKGLDEAFIKSIRVYKYKKEDGFVTCTNCLVCLGEFQEDESIKLLPKCSHAFHAYCIDTWLKTHLNCPLCRANVCCDVKSTPPMLPSPVMTTGLEERDATFEIRDEG